MAKRGSTLVQGTIRPGWLIPAAVVLLLAGFGGAFVGVDALRQFPSNTTVGGAGIGALLVAVIAVIVLVVSSRREIIVDAKGVEIRARGGKSTRILWSEPHTLHYRVPDGDGTGAADRITLQSEDGRRIEVGRVDVPDNPNAAVARVVERHSTSATWARAEEALEAGEKVSFGPLVLGPKRLEVAGHSFEMDGSLCVQVIGGKLSVGAQGKSTATGVLVQHIANFPCLLRAIGQVSQARPPG